MLVQTATGQRPGSTLYHVGDGFYFRVNRQHLKTIYMRCTASGCKVTGSMPSDSSRRTHIRTSGQHNHPPDLYKYELLAFSERLYQRCRVETTSLRTIFQEEVAHTPSEIRPMLVMSHYIKRMQNLRKRLRAQSLRAKINLTPQDDSVLLYEDGTPIKDEVSSSLQVEVQSTDDPMAEIQEGSDDSKDGDLMMKMQIPSQKKFTTHGFDWTEKRINLLLEAMRHYYPEVVNNKDNPKPIWEEIAKDIDADVKWYSVKKKWTQLEDGYRTYMKDLKETGDQGIYRPAYMEEIKEIIRGYVGDEDDMDDDNEYIQDNGGGSNTLSIDPGANEVYIGVDADDVSVVEFSGPIYNSDHLYTSLENIKGTTTSNKIDTNNLTKELKNNDNNSLINTLLTIHKEQMEESRKRMDRIMSAIEENRKESREVTQSIRKLTEAVIQRISTPGRIIVAQKRNHS